MLSVKQILSDSNFQGLPESEKIKVLDSVDSNFSNLPESEKIKVISLSNIEKEKPEMASGVVPEWGERNPNLYGAYGAGKAVFDQVAKPTLEAGGLLGGEIAGLPLGPTGAVAGAGLGYGIAKKGTDVVQEWINKLGERTSNDSQDPKSFLKKVADESIGSAEDVAMGSTMQVLGTKVPELIVGGVQKIAAPMRNAMSASKRELLKIAEKYGITPSATDVVGSKTLGLMESLLEKVPYATDIIRNFRVRKQLTPLLNQLETLKKQNAPEDTIAETGQKIIAQVTDFLSTNKKVSEKNLNLIRNTLQERLGTSQPIKNVGKDVQEILTKNSTDFNKKVSQAYDEVGQAIPEGQYQYPELSKTAKTILEDKSKLAAQDSKMMQHLKWASGEEVSENMAEQLAILPPKVREEILAEMSSGKSWKTLNEFSKEMSALASKEDALKMAQPGMKFQQTPEGAVYTTLKKAARKDLADIAESQGSEAFSKLQQANKIYKEGAEIFKSDEIRKLAKSNPEDVVSAIFKPNGTTEIKLAKQALGDKGFQSVKQGITNKLLGIGEKDVFDPILLQKNIEHYGDAVLKEVFGEFELNSFKSAVKNGLDLTKKIQGESFLKGITTAYPDTVVDMIIGAPEAKLQSTTLLRNIESIKKAISPQQFDSISNAVLDKIITKDFASGLIKPVTFSKMVNKYQSILPKFLPKENIQSLNELSRIASELQKSEQIAGNPSGTAQNVITWGIVGLFARAPLTAGGVLIGSSGLTKLFTTKGGLKYLTEGMQVPVMSEKGAKLAFKLQAILTENENEKGEQ